MQELVKRYGEAGLPEDTIVFNCGGAAGQSFAAFGAPGLTFRIAGDANDYFGKGLSGAKLIIAPPEEATFEPGWFLSDGVFTQLSRECRRGGGG